MKTKWKIFRVINIIEISLISSLIGFVLYVTPLPMNDFNDFLVLSFFLSLPLVTFLNGFQNLQLVRIESDGFGMSVRNKLFFWCITGLFFVVVVLFLVGFIAALLDITKPSPYKNQDITPGIISILLAGAIIILNGSYILVLQISLFVQIRRNEKTKTLSTVEEIGNNFDKG